MRLLVIMVWAASMGAVSPVSAQTFEVIGVDPSDTLSMRRGIDRLEGFLDAEIVAEIPSNATGIGATGVSMNINGALWREVTFRGTVGWVNNRFLKQTDGVATPTRLDCSGTEPFWSLKIQDGKAELSDPEMPAPTKLSLVARREGLNRANLWSYYLATEDKASVLTAVVTHTDRCADGMSDFVFGFEIYLLGFRPGEGPAQGCCSFDR